jgi:hypothetical protein
MQQVVLDALDKVGGYDLSVHEFHFGEKSSLLAKPVDVWDILELLELPEYFESQRQDMQNALEPLGLTEYIEDQPQAVNLLLTEFESLDSLVLDRVQHLGLDLDSE